MPLYFFDVWSLTGLDSLIGHAGQSVNSRGPPASAFPSRVPDVHKHTFPLVGSRNGTHILTCQASALPSELSPQLLVL